MGYQSRDRDLRVDRLSPRRAGQVIDGSLCALILPRLGEESETGRGGPHGGGGAWGSRPGLLVSLQDHLNE
jgi:hypothetical protein